MRGMGTDRVVVAVMPGGVVHSCVIGAGPVCGPDRRKMSFADRHAPLTQDVNI